MEDTDNKEIKTKPTITDDKADKDLKAFEGLRSKSSPKLWPTDSAVCDKTIDSIIPVMIQI